MSLFDVIKYSGTDLNSKEELLNLPEGIFMMYREVAFAFYNREPPPSCDNDMSIEGMIIWEEMEEIKQRIFKTALTNYNSDEPV